MARESTVENLFEPHPLLHGFKDKFPWYMDPSSNPYYSPLYYLINRLMVTKNILEIGLDAGYSSYMLGIAAKENEGMFFGIEKHEGKARRIKNEMDKLEIPSTIIWADSNDIEKWEWSTYLDFMLLDGNHNVRTVLHEMAILYPILRGGGIVCIHDVWAWSAAAWAEILKTYEFAGQISFIQNFGLGIIRKIIKGEKERHQLEIDNQKEWQISDWENVMETRTGKVIVL